MISIVDLKAGYSSNEVIRGLNLNLASGMVHGLVGLNGSGKTTFLKCLAGLHKPTSGSIKKEGGMLKRNEVSFLETEPYFYHGITGREYLSLFRSVNGVQFGIDDWARLFSLPLDALIDGYSTGMKKKLGILGILKLNRPVILLDEPFNGLDLESVRILTTLLQNWTGPERMILITSHILDTLKDCCPVIHYLRNGVISQSFTGDEMKNMEHIVFRDVDAGLQETIKGLIQQDPDHHEQKNS